MNEPSVNYWRILEFADWKNCKDYELIGRKFKQVFAPETLDKAEAFYNSKLDELKRILEDYAEKKTGDRNAYFGLSDDSFWDLRAHIIGLGEKTYQDVLQDPEIAKRMADQHDFKENFGYLFNYTKGKV